MRRVLKALGVCLSMAIPASVLADTTQQVQATGHAYVTSAADKEAARRRAIGDALIWAGLAGGASLRGHSVQNMSRMTTDLTIMRPTGRILSHKLISAQLKDGLWTVTLLAEVGAMPAGACASRRHTTVSSTPPVVRVHPSAPAWTAQLAREFSHSIVDALTDHPDVSLERIAATPRVAAAGASFDYTALTRGQQTSAAAGDHRLSQEITVTTRGGKINLAIDLKLTGPDGKTSRRTITREANLPSGGMSGYLSGNTRSATETALTAGLDAELKSWLDGLSCEPPVARIVMANGDLSVPLGRRHGLTRASLAFVDDPNDNFGLLEIVKLGNRSAELRPLDPTRSAQSFDGLRVYFLEAGL